MDFDNSFNIDFIILTITVSLLLIFSNVFSSKLDDISCFLFCLNDGLKSFDI